VLRDRIKGTLSSSLFVAQMIRTVKMSVNVITKKFEEDYHQHHLEFSTGLM
jgi:hypothetical protein